MISEPELDGEWDGPPRPAEIPGGGAGNATGEGSGGIRARSPLRARAWAALGGAAVASALWAGGLHALGDRPGAPPELAYALPEDLCRVLEVPALTRIAGNLHTNGADSRQARDPVLDQAVCSRGGDRSNGLSYSVVATVQLHRKTDPEAEFGVEPLLYQETVEQSQVPGLGERALMLVEDGDHSAELKVLDGGAVIRLSVYATSFGDDGLPDGSEEKMDATAVQAALIEDMGELLKGLRKK
ncbi:hypothetical protein [Streptomyces sp. NPDC089799]|uniref:hypothetical protein n=1 Tax=Streptomyces sp. NPDC089799 TaxID=3155066 RepID=UPI00341A7677